MTYDTTEGYKFKVGYDLDLTYVGFTRGQSSVLQEFKTLEGDVLCFAAKGTAMFFQALIEGKITINLNRTFRGNFVMKKQGQNARWEPNYVLEV